DLRRESITSPRGGPPMIPLVPTVLCCALILGPTGLPPIPGRGTGAVDGSRPTKAAEPRPPDYTSVIAMLERDLPRLMAENQVPGAWAALIDDQAVIWVGGFGFTDRSEKRRITADTPFSLQSVSKTYTATAFVRAMDQGRFALDEPLKKVVPGF